MRPKIGTQYTVERCMTIGPTGRPNEETGRRCSRERMFQHSILSPRDLEAVSLVE